MKKLLMLLLPALMQPALLFAQVSVGSTKQLSVGLNHQTPAGSSGSPAIAANGKFLAFQSNASNLVSNDTNGSNDIFIRNLNTGALSRASVNSSQEQGNDDSTAPTTSPVGPDGFYAVAFSSFASNLGSLSDPFNVQNVFVRFPTLGLTIPVSFGSSSQQMGDEDSDLPSATITSAPNKVFIAYESFATNLTSNEVVGNSNIFLATITPPANASQSAAHLVTTKLISRAADGSTADSDSNRPKISADGKWIVFTSNASNLLAGKTTIGQQIFLYSVATGKITLVSQKGGVEGDGDSDKPVISFSGRFIAYLTNSTNLISDPVDQQEALVIFDHKTGTTRRVNSASNGTPGDGSANDPSISANGRFVTFSDGSDNLTPHATNGFDNVFVKDLNTGAVAQASLGISGGPDDDSDTTFTAGKTYNSLSGFISYRSFADNLATSSTNGNGDVFVTGATYATPALVNKTQLETPPDVTVNKNNVSIALQKFKLASAREDSEEEESASRPAATKAQIKYDVRIAGKGIRKKTRIEQIQARNSVTVKNLPSGTYTVQYRTVAQTNTTTTATSGFSPRQTFQTH